MPADLRQETMSYLRKQFPPEETQRLLQEFPSLQMLSWGKEIGQLARTGVEIGSHGVHHEIHHQDQLEAIRAFELKESKFELEAATSLPLFCLSQRRFQRGLSRRSARGRL